ncbi:MAG: DUF1570 domain-containing protein [Planctomycetes bacterium]|nr:DUF1570 domain-containing protein [Planctomycetota bacterium]
MLSILFASILLAPGGDSRPLDTVELTNGSKLTGRVVYEDADGIVLLSGSNEREIARDKIARCESRAAASREAFGLWRGLSEDDLAATLSLAKDCRARKLEEEAQLFAWQVLAHDGANAAAHEFLGHERRKDSWLVNDGVRRWPWEKLLELRADWKDAWVLSSEHYRVRTNLPLVEAVQSVLELEGAYESFFELLGRPLRFHELLEPLEAQVHADEKSFPEFAGDARSYFASATHVLYVNASRGFDRGALVHEAAHQLLDACIQTTRTGRGDVPGWLNEGLAEYMRATTLGPLGRPLCDPGALDLGRFREHAGAKEPYDLGRVLTFDSSDFLGSVKSSLKYSASYTLVCWALDSEEPQLRERFFAYLGKVCKGNGSSTAFKSALELDERAIQKDWDAFVRATLQEK